MAIKVYRLVIVAGFLFLWLSRGYCQDTAELIGQVAKVYTGNESSGNGLIGGFSLAGLIGGFLFGGVGFIAFMYGKRNAEFRPMIIGILLMGYPYLVRNTIALYLVGFALTAALYFLRE